MRAAIYGRVSTLDQHVENQLTELRAHCDRRGWTVTEFVDRGVSGAKDRRPALDSLRAAVKNKELDVVVCWRLDRLGRNLRHLILLVDELQVRGVALVSLAEGIDATTPAGKLQLHILGAIAQFERERIQERVKAGLRRVRAQGTILGRRRATVLPDGLPAGLTVRCAAATWGVSKSTAQRWLASGKVPAGQTSEIHADAAGGTDM